MDSNGNQLIETSEQDTEESEDDDGQADEDEDDDEQARLLLASLPAPMKPIGWLRSPAIPLPSTSCVHIWRVSADSGSKTPKRSQIR